MSEAASSSTHKPFIDGLRAVAILAVLGFHVGVPYFSGGFIGVDVFFVISGFLIIGQLNSALADGRHSLVEFWARRVLRILPPYLLVVAGSLVLAHYYLASPTERGDFASQVMWSAGMAANHYFLGQQGYFDTSADVKPLLHLWSLAVEEQFYLVAPLILSAYWMAQRRFASGRAWGLVRLGVPIALALGSFLLCIRFTGGAEEPNYAFFLMPLRAWEFILGGALPWVARAVGSRLGRWTSTVPIAGLALVVGATVGYREETPFPSFTAALPCPRGERYHRGGPS
jgi:peptidoglycan/LPS O-acetylase OafA/YrhL